MTDTQLQINTLGKLADTTVIRGVAAPVLVYPFREEQVEGVKDLIAPQGVLIGLKDEEAIENMRPSGLLYFAAVRAWRRYVYDRGIYDEMQNKATVPVHVDDTKLFWGAIDTTIKRYQRPVNVQQKIGKQVNLTESVIFSHYLRETEGLRQLQGQGQELDQSEMTEALRLGIAGMLLESNSGQPRLLRQDQLARRMGALTVAGLDPVDLEMFSGFSRGRIRSETVWVERGKAGYQTQDKESKD